MHGHEVATYAVVLHLPRICIGAELSQPNVCALARMVDKPSDVANVLQFSCNVLRIRGAATQRLQQILCWLLMLHDAGILNPE